jgi:hypothetical protein
LLTDANFQFASSDLAASPCISKHVLRMSLLGRTNLLAEAEFKSFEGTIGVSDI